MVKGYVWTDDAHEQGNATNRQNDSQYLYCCLAMTTPTMMFLKINSFVNEYKVCLPTVDGRNSAPVDMVDIPLFKRCHTCLVVSWISSIERSKPLHSFIGSAIAHLETSNDGGFATEVLPLKQSISKGLEAHRFDNHFPKKMFLTSYLFVAFSPLEEY